MRKVEMYVACDNKQFYTENECREYEKTLADTIKHCWDNLVMVVNPQLTIQDMPYGNPCAIVTPMTDADVELLKTIADCSYDCYGEEYVKNMKIAEPMLITFGFCTEMPLNADWIEFKPFHVHKAQILRELADVSAKVDDSISTMRVVSGY